MYLSCDHHVIYLCEFLLTIRYKNSVCVCVKATLQVGGHGERLNQCREVTLTTTKPLPVQVRSSSHPYYTPAFAEANTFAIFYICTVKSLNYIYLDWLVPSLGGWWTLPTRSLCHPHQPQKPGEHDSENQKTSFDTAPQWVRFSRSVTHIASPFFCPCGHGEYHTDVWLSSRFMSNLKTNNKYFVHGGLLYICVSVSSQFLNGWESGSAGSVWAIMRLCTMTRTNYAKHVRTTPPPTHTILSNLCILDKVCG